MKKENKTGRFENGNIIASQLLMNRTLFLKKRNT